MGLEDDVNGHHASTFLKQLNQPRTGVPNDSNENHDHWTGLNLEVQGFSIFHPNKHGNIWKLNYCTVRGLPAHHLLQSHHVQSNVDSTAATHVEREGEKEIEMVFRDRDSMPHTSVETGSPSKSISVQQRSRNNPCNILEKSMKELMHPCRRFLAPTTGRPQENHLGHRYIWSVWWRHVLNGRPITIWHGVIWLSTSGGFTGTSPVSNMGG